MIATQTWAVLVDAYRELNAKKLFWITMGLSLLVVLAFAAVGINEKGMSILWWTMEIEAFNSTIMALMLRVRFIPGPDLLQVALSFKTRPASFAPELLIWAKGGRGVGLASRTPQGAAMTQAAVIPTAALVPKLVIRFHPVSALRLQ